MKVIQSVLIAGALSTALAGTASAGQSFAEQAARIHHYVKKGDAREAITGIKHNRFGFKKRKLRQIAREVERKIGKRAKRKSARYFGREFRRYRR